MITYNEYLRLSKLKERTEQEQKEWQEYHNTIVAAKEKEKNYYNEVKNFIPQTDYYKNGLWNLSNIPDLHKELRNEYIKNVEERGCTFVSDKYTEQAINDVCRWLQLRPKIDLLLIGNPGIGKSIMQRTICNIILKKINKVVKNISAIDIIRMLMQHDDEKYNDILHYKYLAIDDLGAEAPEITLYGTKIYPLTELLYTRYDEQLFTIISTNKTKEELGAIYGPRIADRLREMCNVITYSSEQKSYRK